jgi:hypothetical protein
MPTWNDFLSHKLGINKTKPLTILEVTLALASKNLNESLLSVAVDEETITAALLGSLKAHGGWAVDTIGEQESDIGLSWAHFPKSQSSQKFSEAATGADFSLVIRLDMENVLIGLFQAKFIERGKIDGAEVDCIDTYRRPRRPREKTGEKKGQQKVWRQSQLMTLVQNGSNILNNLKISNTGSSDFDLLTWLHYVCYRKPEYKTGTKSGLFCVSVSALEEPYKKEKQKHENNQGMGKNLVKLNGLPKLLFTELIDITNHQFNANKNDPSSKLPPELNEYYGWLKVEFSKLEELLPELITLVDMYIADDSSGGGGSVPTIESKLPPGSKPTWKLTVEKPSGPTPSSTPKPPPSSPSPSGNKMKIK